MIIKIRKYLRSYRIKVYSIKLKIYFMDEIKTSCNEIVQRRIIFMFKETDKTYLFKLIYYSRIV